MKLLVLADMENGGAKGHSFDGPITIFSNQFRVEFSIERFRNRSFPAPEVSL